MVLFFVVCPTSRQIRVARSRPAKSVQTSREGDLGTKFQGPFNLAVLAAVRRLNYPGSGGAALPSRLRVEPSMNPIEFGLRRPITVMVAMVALIGAGGLALSRMKVDIF